MSYYIGLLTIGHALCDLGSNINLMLLSMMRKLNFGEPKWTYGVLEDVLVIVDNLFFPIHYVILDMPEDSETPLLLGIQFLAMGRVG